MLECGGFTLGSTTLGGSTIKLCTDCTPNMIITIEQGLDGNGIVNWYRYISP